MSIKFSLVYLFIPSPSATQTTTYFGTILYEEGSPVPRTRIARHGAGTWNKRGMNLQKLLGENIRSNSVRKDTERPGKTHCRETVWRILTLFYWAGFLLHTLPTPPAQALWQVGQGWSSWGECTICEAPNRTVQPLHTLLEHVDPTVTGAAGCSGGVSGQHCAGLGCCMTKHDTLNI